MKAHATSGVVASSAIRTPPSQQDMAAQLVRQQGGRDREAARLCPLEVWHAEGPSGELGTPTAAPCSVGGTRNLPNFQIVSVNLDFSFRVPPTLHGAAVGVPNSPEGPSACQTSKGQRRAASRSLPPCYAPAAQPCPAAREGFGLRSLQRLPRWRVLSSCFLPPPLRFSDLVPPLLRLLHPRFLTRPVVFSDSAPNVFNCFASFFRLACHLVRAVWSSYEGPWSSDFGMNSPS